MNALSTAYFPPISYFVACYSRQQVLIEQWESYTKQSIRNHCRIYGPNGELRLSVPVNKVNGNHTLTKDILIARDREWQKNHLRSIETAYNKSPYYLYYKDHFARFYATDFEFLVELNRQILEEVFRILRWEKRIHFTEQFEAGILPGFELKKKAPHPEEIVFLPEYIQVFSSKSGFIPDLSILDLIFNLGPEAGDYIASL